jgi:hypothetical protein
MSPSEAEEQAERRRVMLQDADVRRQQGGSTYLDHTHDDTSGGRFAAIGTPYVVGSTPIPKYPELPADSPFHHDPVPPEPPLSADENPALNPSSPEPFPSSVQETGEPTSDVAPSPTPLGDVQRTDVGSPSSLAARRGKSQMASPTRHPVRGAERSPDDK